MAPARVPPLLALPHYGDPDSLRGPYECQQRHPNLPAGQSQSCVVVHLHQRVGIQQLWADPREPEHDP